ncbi:hypothetical protein PC129_g22704 [Phytophthora cactorum]|uniref:Uncharacterized protein n=1 Tax=Phytophthora cactorum TaxID=29920 RepID=A0A8T1D923_9STRA|nr:hypothetical protein Pcac1_g26914 [Phytophthora cactorum]KAG3108617.1 hypothetical protein PI125_g11677 [Phytophthora idaei]KAG2902584.1 hypothetical protein PC114_g12683 [Phytophthora cactorum]KAG2916108.1 hypothetical protein PC115_g11167 [Phytophthora cactorum]KAG2936119.1 hypothetical protein PC117_g12220 [Phytophthora cactorum]
MFTRQQLHCLEAARNSNRFDYFSDGMADATW